MIKNGGILIKFLMAKHFKKISEYLEYINLPLAEHPMLHIISENSFEDIYACATNLTEPITSDFYTIVFKEFLSGELQYGRTKYDFSKGVLLFLAPDQILKWDGVTIANKGFSITFHKDFIKGHYLRDEIKKYGFFDYTVNEALLLTPKEEKAISSLFQNIENEYQNNHDDFSSEIILSHISTLLKYSNRFYKRQFRNRLEIGADISSQFKKTMQCYFENHNLETDGIPSINWVAKELSVSSRYLSDALKAETGKTAIEHIHLFLIDEAKNLLLKPNTTISETAYKLGFEYPQYFTRLFKKKVGVSPTEYIKNHSLN